IGADLATKLYPGTNPIGQQLNIDGHNFLVIGQASVLGNVFGQSQDSFVEIPIGVYRDMYGTRDSIGVNVKAPNALLLPAVTDQVRVLMRNVRHLHYADKDTFGLIGADSLMNIMLAAVTERTREVGIRKALGARRKDILSQFLVESAVLSTVGGAMGIGLAYGFTVVAGAVTPLPFSLPWLAVLAAFVISTSVGLFFGIYPAQKAAKLDPITALRAET